jgi:hypothetical protein
MISLNSGSDIRIFAVGEAIAGFISPLFRAISEESVFDQSWTEGGPWR